MGLQKVPIRERLQDGVSEGPRSTRRHVVDANPVIPRPPPHSDQSSTDGHDLTLAVIIHPGREVGVIPVRRMRRGFAESIMSIRGRIGHRLL